MQFSDIKDIVLGNVQRYGDTSTGIIDLVEKNINRAVGDLSKKIISSALIKLEEITTEDRSNSLDASYTPTSTDILKIMKIRYKYSDGEWPLEEVSHHTIHQKIDDLETVGRPDYYIVNGNTGNIIDIEFYPITSHASETIKLFYLPILSDLSGSQENIITKKYYSEVINIATKYSRENILNEKITEEEIIKLIDYLSTQINSEEQSSPDYIHIPLPPSILIGRRKNRRSI